MFPSASALGQEMREDPSSQENVTSPKRPYPEAGQLDSGSCGPTVYPLFKAVLKRAATKKSRNDLIHAEEGEDRFADLCAVGEYCRALLAPRGRLPACHPGCPALWACLPSPLPPFPGKLALCLPQARALGVCSAPAGPGWRAGCADSSCRPFAPRPLLTRFSPPCRPLAALGSAPPWTRGPWTHPKARAVCGTHPVGTESFWSSL